MFSIGTVKFYDTNTLLVLGDRAFEESFALSSITLQELENIKTSRNKSDEIKHQARTIVRLLDENSDKYNVVVYDDDIAQIIHMHKMQEYPDTQIIASAKYLSEKGNVTFISSDIACKIIAKNIFGLNVDGVDIVEDIYTGYKIIRGTTEKINIAMQNIDFHDWNINEYLIVQNTDDGTEKEMRFDGEKFVMLKLPPSKIIKAKNSLQRCALDILNNPDITIAAILGGYGSGKTYLSMQMALYHILDKGNQSKILGVRSPQGDGVDIGYLPGSADDKTHNFFLPLAQQLSGGEFELEGLKQRGVIESNIPYYMKGTTYDNTIILVDEAEDLDEKQIRLVGTRLGQNSKIYFAGDYKQSVVNNTSGNALIKMCNEFRGSSCFATIYLGEDVRSYTSKMFADLFTK